MKLASITFKKSTCSKSSGDRVLVTLKQNKNNNKHILQCAFASESFILNVTSVNMTRNARTLGTKITH